MRSSHITTQTDSYKEVHHAMYPVGTEVVYSYLESRIGAEYDETTFFGLQYLLTEYLSRPVTREDVEHAEQLCTAHFGTADYFNRAGWMHIIDHHDGKLPLRIKAVPEGMSVPTGNVLLTVENTDPACWWLTNFVESLLTQVWYPCTVATRSRNTKKIIQSYLDATSDNGLADFMLHDFGYRGVSSNESAAIGGAAHLVNFLGTDTLVGIELLHDYYQAEYADIAYSVAATEHSIMTSLGAAGEEQVTQQLLNSYPKGVLSIVSDSFDIYHYVDVVIGSQFRERIITRPEGSPVVVRPDSITPEHTTPEAQMVWIVESLWRHFGGHVNAKGYMVLHPNIRVLWGDGIEMDGVERVLAALKEAGYSAENVATFGMGGGLLQKLNRDTQRFAFKSSAQKRDGLWYDVYKSPKDQSKVSKRGRLALVESAPGKLATLTQCDRVVDGDILQTVFLNGEVLVTHTLAEIRERAALRMVVPA